MVNFWSFEDILEVWGRRLCSLEMARIDKFLFDKFYLRPESELFKEVLCCRPCDHIPQNLSYKINFPLEFVRARNTLINTTLTFLPRVLVELMLDYLQSDTI